jgi:hypothetical protein
MARPNYPVELVRWTDACGPNIELTLQQDDIAEMVPLGMSEVGFLVKEAGDHIVLVPQISEEGGFRRPVCIPKVCIDSRTRLFEKRKRKRRVANVSRSN